MPTPTRFTLDRSTPSLWRVTFDHPPNNLIDSVMIRELGDLVAERYGYVNRAIPDAEFEDFVDRFARRVSSFDRQALADIKHFVDNVSLPADEELPPQMDAFWKAVARPALQARASKAFEDGFQQRSDVELRLGEYVGLIAETDLSPLSS